MKKRNNFLTVLVISTVLCSCVPQRLMEEEQAKRKSCETELAALKTNSNDCDQKLAEAKKELKETGRTIEDLKKDTAGLGKNYRITDAKFEKLNQINEQLLEKYNRLLEGNINDTKKISSELQMTQEEYLKKQDELKKLSEQLNGQKKT